MAPFHIFMVGISFLYLFIFPQHLCFATASKKPTGFSLKLIHRDSPESPLYPGNLTSNERMARYAKWSGVRASYLASIGLKNATNVDNPDTIMRPPVFVDGVYYYMVNLGIGTPPVDVMLLLDTGADLTWTQCQPCESCYYQHDAIYNSLNSKTFKPMHCGHPLCGGILECEADGCWYQMYYGSQSFTSGLAMTETLTFSTNDGHEMVINDVIVGCSKKNLNFNFGSTGNIGGIMGLNASPLSLVSQFYGIIQVKFSYCLTPPGPILSSYLRFGSDIVLRGHIQKTPFVRVGRGYYYGLMLVDISIDDVPIGYPDGTFLPKKGGTGGCFIDSGSPFTLIEQAAFDKFIQAFEKFFAPTRLTRKFRDCPQDNTNCYYTQGVKRYPTITLHFANGANYDVPPANLIWIDPSGKFFMLTIVPADRTVLGAWQQHNVRIVYDLLEGFLYFAPEVCSNDKA